MVSLDIKVPDDLLGLLRLSRDELEREIQLLVALELFRERRISAGKAAEIAGQPLADFMTATRQSRVPWVSYTQDELEAELREAQGLGQATRMRDG